MLTVAQAQDFGQKLLYQQSLFRYKFQAVMASKTGKVFYGTVMYSRDQSTLQVEAIVLQSEELFLQARSYIQQVFPQNIVVTSLIDPRLGSKPQLSVLDRVAVIMQWYDIRQLLLIVSGSSCEDQYTEVYATQFCLHTASQTLYYRNNVITTICFVSALSYAALLLAKYYSTSILCCMMIQVVPT